MAKARKNPLGRYFPDVIPVVVGNGDYVHIYHPVKNFHICKSGKNAGKAPINGPDLRQERLIQYYESKARFITCWRCLKLASINMAEGREPWRSSRD